MTCCIRNYIFSEEIFDVAKLMENDNVVFHFVGNLALNFKDYYGKFIPENLDDLPDNIKVWDERDDVDSFYSSCDLFYFASTMECNPLVIKEALSWNMPILMRDLKYLDGMYDDNNNISYIDNNINNTVDAIYKKLNIQTDDKNASSLDIVSSNWMEIE